MPARRRLVFVPLDQATVGPGYLEVIALFLLLVIAAIVLGIVGAAAKGLLYLLIIGIAVFLAALILAALRMRRRPGRRPAR
jgi:hypothetical protein